MENIKIIISLLFIILSVWYVNNIASLLTDERLILLRIVLIFVTLLMCMCVIDIVVFIDIPLLKGDARSKIFEMIRNLLIGVVAFYLYNNKPKE
jgi:hypothetical protein